MKLSIGAEADNDSLSPSRYRIDQPDTDGSAKFSLPLALFERYMLANDQPDYPMTFTIQLIFSGRFEPELFAAALEEAVRCEPLLSARLEGDSKQTFRWVEATREAPWCDCQPCGVPMKFPDSEQIDLRRQPGLRTWIRHDADRVEVRFQFHHACCDGLGAERFMDNVMRFYHLQVNPDSTVKPRATDPTMLIRRDQFKLTWLQSLLRIPLNCVGVGLGSLSFFGRTPTEIASPEAPFPTAAELQTLTDLPSQQLPAETVFALKQAARTDKVAVNDLLTTELLLALRDWQEAVTGRGNVGLLRVIVPITLRSSAHKAMPAANVVGMVPIERGAFSLGRPGFLLKSVNNELIWLKKTRMALSFLNVLRSCEALLGNMKPLTTRNRCPATACFSNVGRVFAESPLPREDGRLRTGDLLLESVTSAPPVRPRMAAAFMAINYRGMLNLVLNYDRLSLTHKAANDLLQVFVGRLQRRAAQMKG